MAIYTPSDETGYETVRDVPVKVCVFRAVDASMFSVDAAGLAYDGSVHEPAVSSAVVPEGPYSVEYRDNVNAGEAATVVSGFYSGSCELKFAIAKAKPDCDSPAPVEAAYGQTLSDVALPKGFSWQAGNYIALPGHWATGSGGWWYPYDNGGYPANEWRIIDGSYYHFDGSGYMQTGWLNLGGTWYYLSGSGIMQTGWQKIGGSWYWFDDSGAMASGWKWIDGSCCYFDGSGAMRTDKRIDGSYVDSDGRWAQNP